MLTAAELAEKLKLHPDTVRLKAGNLRRLMEELSGMSMKSRMERFGLREDRADVILPACFVYHRIAELNGSEEILVPRVSLKDGVVQEILEQAKGAIFNKVLQDAAPKVILPAGPMPDPNEPVG